MLKMSRACSTVGTAFMQGGEDAYIIGNGTTKLHAKVFTTELCPILSYQCVVCVEGTDVVGRDDRLGQRS